MKRKIVICMGSSCFARGNEENLRVIEDFLKSNHLEADVLIFGHTHVPLELRLTPDRAYEYAVTKPLILLNPGSLGDREASFGTLTIRGGQLLPGHGQL